MYVSAIVAAAGEGLRLGTRISKPLIKIRGVPLIVYSLVVLNKSPLIKEIIVAVNSLNQFKIKETIRRFGISKVKDIVLGGLRRQDSVYNGLKVIGKKADFVLIHDAARPFIDKNTISRLVKEVYFENAAILGVPVKATIKRVSRVPQRRRSGKLAVDRTIDRSNLWEIQTPQVFRKELISEAYERFGSTEVTDEAMLVEKLGVKIAVVLGSYSNIKITTPEDLVSAEAIVRCKARIYPVK